MIIVSRFTPQPAYEAAARRLLESCRRFDLPCLIERVKQDPGSWNDAVNAKPDWILNTLLNRREAILWLDADCEIVQMPTAIIGTSADVACYNFAADSDGVHGIAYDPNKLVCATGVLWVAYTAGAIELLLRWMSAIKQHPDIRGSDPCLDLAYNTCRPPVHTLWLPKSYNRMDSLWPGVDPVIDHHYCEGKLRDAS